MTIRSLVNSSFYRSKNLQIFSNVGRSSGTLCQHIFISSRIFSGQSLGIAGVKKLSLIAIAASFGSLS
jgi:hypothetical protein